MALVGTMKPQKGHHLLIEAVRQVAPRFANLHVLFVGDGERRAELEAQAAASGAGDRIHFLGSRGDVPDLLAACDSFVLPSLWEGLPMALIEAMASGLPVIASEVSGTKQVVTDGESGLLIPPGDVAALAEAIAALLADPARAREIGAAGRRRVEAAFSAKKQAEEHVALYRRALARSSAGARTAMPKHPNDLKLAYIIGTYPSLTMTFIDREIRSLRGWGVGLRVLSIRRPRGALSDEQRELGRGVAYLLPVPVLAFIAAHLRFAVLRPAAYFGALLYLLTRRHPTLKARAMTLLHFAEGVYAAELLRGCDQIHAHFVDRSATLALVAGRLLGVPYSVTAHANDIYVEPVLLPEKLSNARFVATCTGYNRAHLAALGADGLDRKLSCIYHGLDVGRYRPNGGPPPGRPVVVAVGQLKEKKGFAHLLDACRLLKDRGYDLDCHIIGEGPLRAALEAQIRRLGLEDRVALRGALPHDAVIEAYRRATLFVLPCVTGANGDRDGIPNVILEAMAMGLPVVSTDHSGIPEVVENGVDGLLVPPADAAALAGALARLLDDAAARRDLGAKAREKVAERFDAERNVRLLLEHFIA
jgi:glycosyltransferase involved in cell wall biosynthesis